MKEENNNEKLGVLIIGLGATTTTFLAGVESIRKNKKKPVGTLTQIGKIKVGDSLVNIKDLLPLTSLDNLEFLTWDLFPDNGFESASRSGVLNYLDLEESKEFLSSIKPAKAVFNKKFVKNIDASNKKDTQTHRESIEALKKDIEDFKKEKNVSRMVMLWSASTEVYFESQSFNQSLESFEKALDENNSEISPSQLYAYSALSMGIPFINGAPNMTVDNKAFIELADKNNTAIVGKDYKTGQTLMKTILAPGLKTRLLGLNGWFSTNILGNRDGKVLDDPASFKTKEVSKLSVLDTIFDKENNPGLYDDINHKVRINYYPPREDNKESWDNIDIFGWMDYPMQIKINFLCRDSILAAPVMLDVVLLMDLAIRKKQTGIQDWMAFFFKSPQTKNGALPVHSIFEQEKVLFDKLIELSK